MGLGGIQAWIFSFYPPTGWMDGQLASLWSFSIYFFFIPVISGRREEDNIKCAMEPLFDLYTYIACIK